MPKKIARLVFPEVFSEQTKLLGSIVAKDTALGAASPIRPFLTEKGIVLADDETAATAATTYDTERDTLVRSSEKKMQDRNNLFNPVFKSLTGIIQFLKKLYRGAEHKLGDWGVTVNGTRVSLPKTFADKAALFTAVKAKHDSYVAPAVSPIAAYLTENSINIVTNAANTALAVTADDEAVAERRSSEAKTAERDLRWNPPVANMRGIGQFLIGFYNANPKKAGDFGFVVDDSPQAPKLRKTKVLPTLKVVAKGAVIGGTLTNTGTVSLVIYKGIDTTVEGVTVLPSNKLAILPGWSTITVSNQDALITGTFTLLVSGG